jgi:hypothetical protein
MMTNELDDACARLKLKYPYQFGADFFEFNPSFESGWMPIFERLCDEVDRALDGEVKALFRWRQVKEKLGGLRAYWSFGFDDPTHSAFRKTSAGIAIIRAIQSAEDESDRTCEVCGATPAVLGRAADDAGYRIQTLCDEHIGERILVQQHRLPLRPPWIYLFLDFDGVLHPDEVYVNNNGTPLLPSHKGSLFMWAPVLVELLDPYPNVRIILSTDWVRRLGTKEAADYLVEPLKARVVGSTAASRGWKGWKERGIAVENYVNQNAVAHGRWIALDDDDAGWTIEGRRNLIWCDADQGISSAAVQADLAERLKAMTDDGRVEQ